MSDKQIVTGNNNVVAGGDIIVTQPTSYIFNPKILAEIVNALYENIPASKSDFDDFSSIDLMDKNLLNGVDQVFFDTAIKETYPYFLDFDKFFESPINQEIKEKYKSILIEIQGRIISDLCKGEKLQDILPKIFDYAKVNHFQLFKNNLHYLTILSYYMYTRCDIGIKQ